MQFPVAAKEFAHKLKFSTLANLAARLGWPSGQEGKIRDKLKYLKLDNFLSPFDDTNSFGHFLHSVIVLPVRSLRPATTVVRWPPKHLWPERGCVYLLSICLYTMVSMAICLRSSKLYAFRMQRIWGQCFSSCCNGVYCYALCYTV